MMVFLVKLLDGFPYLSDHSHYLHWCSCHVQGICHGLSPLQLLEPEAHAMDLLAPIVTGMTRASHGTHG